MERQREGRDDLACTVAHELKSGLAALICYADLLQASWATMPGEGVRRCERAIAWNGHKQYLCLCPAGPHCGGVLRLGGQGGR